MEGSSSPPAMSRERTDVQKRREVEEYHKAEKGGSELKMERVNKGKEVKGEI